MTPKVDSDIKFPQQSKEERGSKEQFDEPPMEGEGPARKASYIEKKD